MSKGDFVRFLRIARGSLYELETLYELCKRLGYLDDVALSKATLLSDEIGRMLGTLMERLDQRRWK